MLHYVTIVCLLGAAHTAPSGLINQGIAVTQVGLGSVSNPAYGFNYAVSDPLTGDNKAQSEQREGGVVKGSYSLSEPDGTIRVVDYTADPVTGFNAVVKRIGAAGHPQQLVAPVAKVVAAPVVSKAIYGPIGPIGPISSIGLGYGQIGLGLKGGLSLAGLGLQNELAQLGALELAGLGVNAGLWKH